MQMRLHDFFKEKAARMLKENSLLISRWSHFCRTSQSIVKYRTIFSGHQSRLKAEYSDSIERYERLHELKLSLDKEAKEEEAGQFY